jgi:hypothetical protein
MKKKLIKLLCIGQLMLSFQLNFSCKLALSIFIVFCHYLEENIIQHSSCFGKAHFSPSKGCWHLSCFSAPFPEVKEYSIIPIRMLFR